MTELTVDLHQARFLVSAPNFRQCPPDAGVEVAFCGRSNAGKSSALNRLTGQAKLARTSKTPGRTQHINFFDLEADRRLVDLPGYGYAKVPREHKLRWQEEMSAYLQRRHCLRGLILVSDIRRQLAESDRRMLGWAGEISLPAHVLLTKADKLRPGAARQTLHKLRLDFPSVGTISLQLFSSVSGTGVDEAREVLIRWFSNQ